jgi:hypothetical protein
MRPAPPAGDATATADEDVMEILAIDPTTGVVTLEDVEWFLEKKPPVRFTLTVTDSQGLAAERIVALNRAPSKAGPAKRRPQAADK